MRTPQETRRHRGAAARRTLLAAGLRTRYEQGATLGDLVTQCGRSARTVRRLLQEAGATLRTPLQARQLRKATAAFVRHQLMAALRSRYEAGQSVPALAADHGCSVTTIYRLLRTAGTPMRPPQRPGPQGRRAGRPP
ncbi:helix-turn-helix domain-containing protein [Streptomyces sp. RKAG293]|nr:helix-turn-helix domain-containing protein [Streptomyces sp. RKAG293]MCM2419071.1 helix-turn-helix domain-containing protein [Streptomyces sp. RKAG293]MCM2428734.1 helix-turn-helix domain-containing protein [Streptomyces sp. RKAG337]